MEYMLQYLVLVEPFADAGELVRPAGMALLTGVVQIGNRVSIGWRRHSRELGVREESRCSGALCVALFPRYKQVITQAFLITSFCLR